jgi:ribosome-associated toxin RatA of RatAB toxin-antitoxin module
MADESTQSIEIAASPADVMAVIADFSNYPVWAGSVQLAEVTEPGSGARARRVAFTLEAGPVRDQYELEYTWTGDDLVEWTLVSGQMMRAQHGWYELSPTADGTHVTYYLSVDLAIPMLGLLKRKAQRVVMDTALNALKKRVEAMST